MDSPLDYEIRDTFEWEWDLAKILLRNKHCMYPFQELKLVKTGKNRVTNKGIVYINTTQYEANKDFLHTDIKHLIASLYTGIFQHNKYHWQKVAHKLGGLAEITAQDMCECKYCGHLTPFTMVKMCVDCKRIYDAVTSEPKLAAQILDELTEGGNTSL